MTATNIYEDILANIDADKKAWCQGEWTAKDDDGKPISRCLVEHVDLAVGTSYVKPDGTVFVSKDPKRYRRRERVLARLVSLLPEKVVLEETGYSSNPDDLLDDPWFDRADFERRREQAVKEATTPVKIGKNALSGARLGLRRPYESPAENVVVGFNDNFGTTKAKVRNLLKRAAKSHPED